MTDFVTVNYIEYIRRVNMYSYCCYKKVTFLKSNLILFRETPENTGFEHNSEERFYAKNQYYEEFFKIKKEEYDRLCKELG